MSNSEAYGILSALVSDVDALPICQTLAGFVSTGKISEADFLDIVGSIRYRLIRNELSSPGGYIRCCLRRRGLLDDR